MEGVIIRTDPGLRDSSGGADNLGDSEETLRGLLAASFGQVRIRVVGSAAMFAAEGPRAETAP